MQIEYEGKTYPYDLDDVTVKQAMAIEAFAGMRFSAWARAVKEGGDLKLLQVVGWLLLKGGDLETPIGDVDFKIGRLKLAFDEAAVKDAPPDPTVRAPGRSRRKTTTAQQPVVYPEGNGAATLSAASLTAAS